MGIRRMWLLTGMKKIYAAQIMHKVIINLQSNSCAMCFVLILA